MSSLHALLFDVDGTLADTERDGHRVAFNLAFSQAGLDWHWDVALYGALLNVTGGKERIRHYLDHYCHDFTRPTDLDDFIASLHHIKTAHYTALLARGEIPLRIGVRRLLEEARAEGLRLGIATTTTPANVEALLEHALAPGAQDWFEVIAAGDIVAAKKPAPDIYTYALEAMGLTSTACLAFEDSGNGLRSACAAGLSTVVTVNDYTRGHDLGNAAIVLDHLGEPDIAFTVLGGEAGTSRYLDVALIRMLHAHPAGIRYAHD